MARVRVHNFTISLDGYGAGPRQTREVPLGVGGEALHEWFIATRAFQRINGKTGGTTGVDDDMAARFGVGVGAWIMGRNMFGPVRGPWPDDAWRGWWGKNPPYHGPVFVLTHHSRASIEMEGGTVFHFVTDGIHDALKRATAAAAGKDVEIGGGVSTIRQFLEARLIDELHVAIAPRLLGSGEHLFYGIDLTALGYECTSHVPTAAATHVVLTKTGNAARDAVSLNNVQNESTLIAAEPQLFVRDIAVSADFYTQKLGFSVAFIYGDPPFYGQVRRDGARLNLRCVDNAIIDASRRYSEQLLAASVALDDPMPLFLEYQAAGVEFVQPLRSEPWGARTFIVRDPDGNLILFAGQGDSTMDQS